MSLNYGGQDFAVEARNWRFPQADAASDRPPRIEVDLVFSTWLDYATFRGLRSIVDWRRPLGATTWTAVTQAGHGGDTLVIPRAGPGNATTYTDAYLTGLSPEGSAGKAGLYFVKATFELAGTGG